MTNQHLIHRRARTLARLLTTAIAGVLGVLLLVPVPTDGPIALWVIVLRYALVAALVWALAASASAAHALRPQRSRQPAAPSGRLVAVLLAVAGWTVTGAAHASPVPPTTIVAAAPVSPIPAASSTPPYAVAAPCPVAPAAPSPDWLPARPPATAPADRDPLMMPCTRPSDEPPTVVVHRGDTLWSIVDRHLGPDADPGTIAAAIPRWHAANRATIGPDPDLLTVGEVLTVPGATS